jgi:hypothetical protein
VTGVVVVTRCVFFFLKQHLDRRHTEAECVYPGVDIRGSRSSAGFGGQIPSLQTGPPSCGRYNEDFYLNGSLV